MQFGINIPNFGPYSNPHLVAELAYEAEESGWDGFFIWDHITYRTPETPHVADPWIELAAIAMRTKRIKLGPMVIPLPRRRPWKVAREAVTLDQLSGGRLILGIGLGSDRSREFSTFGETTDSKLHGEMLDEGLDVLTKFWSGEAFNFEGLHYQITGAHFLPVPLQQPRIPIWIAGFWPNKKPFRRAAQWDGVFPLRRGEPLLPQDFKEVLTYIHERRRENVPYDVVASGQTSSGEHAKCAATIAAFAEAGATWWQECFTWDQPLEQVRAHIQQGPLKR